MPAVVSDTSPLVYLTRLGHFSWLREFYSEILIPPAVWEELANQGAAYPESIETRNAVHLGWMKVKSAASPLTGVAMAELDPGEREAIALAKEFNALLIIDEADGRRAAALLGIRMTCTLGLLIEAKSRGLVASVRAELDRLTTLTTFRMSDDLRKLVLREAGENDSKT